MAYYEVDGVHYEIPTDDPEIAKTKIREHLGLSQKQPEVDTMTKLGRTAAGFADTAAGAISGTLGAVAYPFARAGRSADEAQGIVEKYITQPMAQPVGRAFGVTQTPEYKGEATQRAMGAVAPVMSQGINYAAEQTGLPAQDIESYLNTAGMALGPKVAGITNRGVGKLASAEIDATNAVKGAGQAATQGVRDVARGIDVARIGEYEGAPSAYQPVNPGALQQLTPREQKIVQNQGGRVETQGMGAQAFGENLYNNLSETLKHPTEHLGRIALQGLPAMATGGASLPFTMLGEPLIKTLRDTHLSSKIKAVPESQGEILKTDTGFVGGAVNPKNVSGTATINPETGAVQPTAPQSNIGDMFQRSREQFPTYDEVTHHNAVINERAQQLRDIDPRLTARAARDQAIKDIAAHLEEQKKLEKQQKAEAERLAKEQEQAIRVQQQMGSVAGSGMTSLTPEQSFATNPLIKPIRERAEASRREANPAEVALDEKAKRDAIIQQVMANRPLISADKLKSMKEGLAKTELAPVSPDDLTLEKEAKIAQREHADEIMGYLKEGNMDALRNMGVATEILDTSKGVYGDSNSVRGMAKWLEKNGVDEIPVVEGLKPSEVIAKLYNSKKSNVSFMKTEGDIGPVAPREVAATEGTANDTFKRLKLPANASELEIKFSTMSADKLQILKDKLTNVSKEVGGNEVLDEQIALIDKWIKIDRSLEVPPITELEGKGTADRPFASKEEFDKANLLNIIGKKPMEGHYLDESGNKISVSSKKRGNKDQLVTKTYSPDGELLKENTKFIVDGEVVSESEYDSKTRVLRGIK